MSGVITISPPASPVASSVASSVASPMGLSRKRERDIHSEAPPAKKRVPLLFFTVPHETYIAQQLMDPAIFSAYYGSDVEYSGQSLHPVFCQGYAEMFNKKFNTSITKTALRNKINDMKRRWKGADRMKNMMMTKGEKSNSEMKGDIERHCHYYFTMEPALTIATKPARLSKRLAATMISDIDDNNGDGKYDFYTGSRLTVKHETFIAKQLMDPTSYAACSGPGSKYIGQQLNLAFCGKFAGLFNKKFNTPVIGPKRMLQKIGHMRRQWKRANQTRISMVSKGIDVSLPEMQDLIKEQCHYYFIMEPAWGSTMGTTEAGSVVKSERSISTAITDTEDDVDYNDDYSDNEDVSFNQPEPSIGRQRNMTVLAEKSNAEQPQQKQDKASASPPRPDEMDLLGMLKDLKDTSRLQCEAEREQTRREQMQSQERDRVQQETLKLDQLHVEELRLRVEETRIREEELTKRLKEEETTKREAIQAEMEKSKDQIRMRELDIEHINKMLLLEEARHKRAVMEKESLDMLKTEVEDCSN
ncbi:MAG: hypothetical protein J3Q66DRAFT_351262 [Benniella sp.]|nr:MAG: hypothetical protein J3Q66DRAFT_351262 [Benniella sp.]